MLSPTWQQLLCGRYSHYGCGTGPPGASWQPLFARLARRAAVAGQSWERLCLPRLCWKSLLHTGHHAAAPHVILVLLVAWRPLSSHLLGSLPPSAFSTWAALLPKQFLGRSHGYRLLMLKSCCNNGLELWLCQHN